MTDARQGPSVPDSADGSAEAGDAHWFLSDFSSFAREHPGLVVSGAYLAATLLGMLSSWTFYRRFDINIFHYAQLSDFILSALRMPVATLAILLAFPAVWSIIRLDDWLIRRWGWFKLIYGPPAFRAMSRSTGALVVYFGLYAYSISLVYSSWMADRVRGGEAQLYEAELQGGTYLGSDGTSPFEARLLGTTSTYVFLYDDDSAAVTVVPLENLSRLSPR